MALTAYCKKCAREVDAGEICPYCGSRLGKNAAHAAWCVERAAWGKTRPMLPGVWSVPR